MRKRPLLLLASISVLAVLCAENRKWYLVMMVICLSIYAQIPLVFKRKWKRLLARGMGIGLVFFMTFGITDMQMQKRQRELAQIQADQEVLLLGKIDKKEYKNEQFVYELTGCKALSLNQTITCNHVLIYLDADDYSIGETLIIKGKVNMFSEARNEGNFDLRSYYESQQIDFYLWMPEIVKHSNKQNFLAEHLYQLRLRIQKVYLDAIGTKYGGVLSAMLLGEKSEFDDQVKELYQAAGIAHLCALSGLHMSLIGLSLYRFLRKRRWSFFGAFQIAFLVLLMYANMTGESVSTQRAVGMIALYMIAAIAGRKYDMLSALGFAVILLLWKNPFWLHNAGFLFSVISILGIGIVGTWIEVEIKEEQKTQKFAEQWKNKWKKFINNILSGTGIWLCTLPLVAYYYYEIPIYAVLLNLLVLPLLKILFGFGIAGGLAGLIHTGIVPLILLSPCKWILWIYEHLAAFFYGLPNSQWITGQPSAAKIISYYVILLAFAALCMKLRKSYALRVAGIALLSGYMLFVQPRQKFEIDFLDVGQGDGIYLCTENGSSVFVDGGSTSVTEVGTNRILPFLKAKGIRKIDDWMVTHADEDHISGIREILDAGYPIRNLVIAESAMEDEAMQSLAAQAQQNGCEIVLIRAGDRLVFDQEELQCIWPQKGESAEDRNELSLVLYYQSSHLSGILTGDIPADVEEQLIGQNLCRKIDFYKAAHHGSKYSNSLAFLQKLDPEIAIISCSSTNRYGHPSQEAIENIESVEARLYCTMDTGQVKISLDSSGDYAVWTKEQ